MRPGLHHPNQNNACKQKVVEQPPRFPKSRRRDQPFPCRWPFGCRGWFSNFCRRRWISYFHLRALLSGVLRMIGEQALRQLILYCAKYFASIGNPNSQPASPSASCFLLSALRSLHSSLQVYWARFTNNQELRTKYSKVLHVPQHQTALQLRSPGHAR